MSKKEPLPIALHGLRYTGDGTAIDNVPARDLSADEAAQYDIPALIKSGLYEPSNDAPPVAAEGEV